MYSAAFLQPPIIEVFDVVFLLAILIVIVITALNKFCRIDRPVTTSNNAIKSRMKPNRVDSLLFSGFGG